MPTVAVVVFVVIVVVVIILVLNIIITTTTVNVITLLTHTSFRLVVSYLAVEEEIGYLRFILFCIIQGKKCISKMLENGVIETIN
jgi:hypothetical protein